MKTSSTPDLRQSRTRGAALLMVLLFLAGTTIVAVSLLTVSREKVRHAASSSLVERGSLAVRAGFEEAKTLLLRAAASDDYLVSCFLTNPDDANDPDIAKRSRYAYISRLKRGGALVHFPLFAGGKLQETIVSGDIHEMAPKPALDRAALFDASFPEEAEAIQGPGLSHYRMTGHSHFELVRERDIVQTRWVNLPGSDRDAVAVRYTYWIEDLQGYPNVDVVGIPSPTASGCLAQTWGGYGYHDPRLERSYLPYPGCPHGFVIEFPRTLSSGGATQSLVGIPVPGLSPRELHLMPRALPGLSPQDHPLWRAAHLRLNPWCLLSGGSGPILSGFPKTDGDRKQFAQGLEDRFAMGLHPYRERPLIPFGHGYNGKIEGMPRVSLNRIVHEAKAAHATKRIRQINEITEVIEENLPQFAQRKGAFPEDYLRTLAASMIDYADEDSYPTVSAAQPPFGADAASAFRGMDSMPVVNECFLRLMIQSISGAHPDYTISFRLTPCVELWNPSNQEITGARLGLRLVFLKRLGVWISDFPPLSQKKPPPFVIDGPVLPSSIGAGIGELTPEQIGQGYPVMPKSGAISLKPNEHRVVEFEDYSLKTSVTIRSPDITRLSINTVKINSPDGQMAEFHYQIFQDLGGAEAPFWVKIDQSGRPSPFDRYLHPVDNKDEEFQLDDFNYGFGVNRFCPPVIGFGRDYSFKGGGGTNLVPGDYMISCNAPGLLTEDASQYSNWGDSRMAYYVGGGHIEPFQYVDWGSPGFRNVRHEVKSQGRYPDEARFWDWPDRGFPCSSPPLVLYDKKPLLPNEPGILQKVVESDGSKPETECSTCPAHYAPMAPTRISNKGRYYSVAEFGNIFDPVMWKSLVTSTAFNASSSWETKDREVMNIGPGSTPDQRYGGGNTLRIGRPEHPLFDVPGLRACHLVDLFHAGVPGTPAEFTGGAGDYKKFDPLEHHPPRTAPSAAEANDTRLPFLDAYPVEEHRSPSGEFQRASHDHAESPFRWVNGQINLNSAPTLFEVEMFLNGAFSTASVTWTNKGTDARSQAAPGDFRPIAANETALQIANTLNQDPGARDGNNRPKKTTADVARILYERRPFVSPSDLAYEVARAIGPDATSGDALPHQHSDAMAEEIFARILNCSTLSSRHFRIHVHGEVLSRERKGPNGVLLAEGGRVTARASRVYDVYVRAHRVMDPKALDYGKIVSTQLEVLQVRDL